MQLEYSKIKDEEWKRPPGEATDSGNLVVSENPKHVMHWKEFGNPKGEPMIFIHGGPGGGMTTGDMRFFDPERYRVIMFDQRGCGDSKPNVSEDLKGALAENI